MKKYSASNSGAFDQGDFFHGKVKKAIDELVDLVLAGGKGFFVPGGGGGGALVSEAGETGFFFGGRGGDGDFLHRALFELRTPTLESIAVCCKFMSVFEINGVQNPPDFSRLR